MSLNIKMILFRCLFFGKLQKSYLIYHDLWNCIQELLKLLISFFFNPSLYIYYLAAVEYLVK